MSSSPEQIQLRLATIEDAQTLLEWRNDSDTRKASHNTAIINDTEHFKWLNSVLIDPKRRLYVAEIDGIPVGTVRADIDGQGCEISWTVAPEKRGLGFGKRMVSLLVKQIRTAVRAEVKKGNIASTRIAEEAGMRYEWEDKGILHYRRDAIT